MGAYGTEDITGKMEKMINYDKRVEITRIYRKD